MKLLAACRWERLLARNVIAVLRGTAPDFTPQHKRETVVLAAPLDALCDVPGLSIGARDAANVSALLQLAERFAANRPMRDVMFCFFDAQAANHQGARNLYAELFRKYDNMGKKSHAERLDDLQQECGFLDAAIAIYDQDELFNPKPGAAKYAGKAWAKRGLFAPVLKDGSDADLLAHHQAYAAPERQGEFSGSHDQAMLLLSSEAVRFDGEALTQLRPARVELKKASDALQGMRLQLGEGGPEVKDAAALRSRVAAAQAEVRELAPRVERLRMLDLLWNCIQRVIHEKNGAVTAQELLDIEDYAQKAVVFSKVSKPSDESVKRMDQLVAALDIDDAAAVEKLFRDQGLTDEEASAKPTISRSDRESLVRQLQLAILKHHVPRKFQWLVGYTRTLCRDRRTVVVGQLVPWTQANLAIRRAIGAENNTLVLHVSVNLGDARRRWTFIHGEDSEPLFEDIAAMYSSVFKNVKDVQERLGMRVA
ncbi:MAG: M28 family peptidase, partial [Planctomycetota bacterium]|nr:M28 family peptidase [Planctomycetota bacterium]